MSRSTTWAADLNARMPGSGRPAGCRPRPATPSTDVGRAVGCGRSWAPHPGPAGQPPRRTRSGGPGPVHGRTSWCKGSSARRAQMNLPLRAAARPGRSTQVSDLHERRPVRRVVSRGSRALWTPERCASDLRKHPVRERCGSKYPGLRRISTSQGRLRPRNRLCGYWRATRQPGLGTTEPPTGPGLTIAAQRPRRRARRCIPAAETGERGRPNGSMNSAHGPVVVGTVPSRTLML